MTDDGQLVVVQKPDQMPAAAAPFGSSAPLGSSAKLGEGGAVLGRRTGRRAAQGAGVVVSGLVLGALALVTTSSADEPKPQTPPDADRPAVSGGGQRPAGRLRRPCTPPVADPPATPTSPVIRQAGDR